MISSSIFKSFFTFALTVNILIRTSGASMFNCSEPPNFGSYDINNCCRVPEISLGTVPEKCDTYIKALKEETFSDYGSSSSDKKSTSSNNINDTNTNNNNNPAPDYPSYMHICYPECIYRETGSLEDGEIRIENVKKFLNKNVSGRDKDIVTPIVRSFETCLSNIKGHLQAVGLKMYRKLPAGCSPYASMVYICVNAETFLHCPEKMWKNEHYCNLARNFVAQCNPLPHVPMPIV